MTQARVARLGEGKWHTIAVLSGNAVFTACSNKLQPFKSSIRTVTVEIKDGEPDCKLCIRIGKAQS